MRSKSRFVSPYGLTGARGASSGIGVTLGWPYTAHEDENTTRRTPAAAARSRSTRPAVTLLARYISGSATDSPTRAYAARCKIGRASCRERVHVAVVSVSVG